MMDVNVVWLFIILGVIIFLVFAFIVVLFFLDLKEMNREEN